MKVLVIGRVLPTEQSGSYGLFEFEQASALSKFSKTGFMFIETSSLLTNKKVGMYSRMKNNIPVVGYYLPVKGLPEKIYQSIRTKLFIKMLTKFIDENWIPDIIHIHFPLIVINDEILDFLLTKKCKIIVTEHQGSVQKKQINNRKIKLLKRIYDNTHSFISVSQELKDSIEELIEEGNSKIKVIPNMISDIFFSDNKKRMVNSNSFIFTYIGSLTKTKQVDMLIKSFEYAFKDYSDVYLRIIGDGSDRKKLVNLVSDNVGDRIKFYGNQPKEKVYTFLSDTSVYVSASSYETFGVPFIEAMSMGIPVISDDTLPIKTYINQNNGILFETNNQDDLSKKMLYMYNNLSEYDKEYIKKDIHSNFSGDEIAQKLIEIYAK